MPERESFLISEPTNVWPEVLTRVLRHAMVAIAEVLQEMGSLVDREPALSAFEGLPA